MNNAQRVSWELGIVLGLYLNSCVLEQRVWSYFMYISSLGRELVRLSFDLILPLTPTFNFLATIMSAYNDTDSDTSNVNDPHDMDVDVKSECGLTEVSNLVPTRLSCLLDAIIASS